MKIKIKVSPGAKQNKVEKKGEIYKVHTTAPAKEGKANQAVVQIISKRFKVPKSRVSIVKGLKSKEKTVIVEI